ncbi:C40 family peptidase [Priestia aryabhattai]|uniref:C40 family peptidase n=1 Tax=Priestia aryabhattai TaxID=412384 RepID=UPI00255A17B6|nr:bifunctional lytic transglycosylase/C40 family peptidase [Priestia aryabhattai]
MQLETQKKIGAGILLRLLFIGGIPLLLTILLICVATFAAIMAVFIHEQEQEQQNYIQQGVITPIGEREIPAEYIKIYQAAAQKYNVKWELLCAIHRVETHFGADLNVSSVGALGHTQFMPKTWVGWSYPGGTRLGNASIPKNVLEDPLAIKRWGGFGVDADGDGRADPWNVTDAIYSTANYLSASGASDGTVAGMRKAVFAYNQAGWYVDRVFKYMNLYASNGATQVSIGLPSMPYGTGSGKGSDAINKAIAVGSTLVGKSPYNFGGGRTAADIARKSFDCSSFVRWAFEQGGVNLGRVDSTTTDTLVKLGKPVNPSQMRAGDLVFFDTYKKNGHVGIVMQDGRILHDGSSKGVWINDMNHFRKVFSGVVRRVVE